MRGCVSESACKRSVVSSMTSLRSGTSCLPCLPNPAERGWKGFIVNDGTCASDGCGDGLWALADERSRTEACPSAAAQGQGVAVHWRPVKACLQGLVAGREVEGVRVHWPCVGLGPKGLHYSSQAGSARAACAAHQAVLAAMPARNQEVAAPPAAHRDRWVGGAGVEAEGAWLHGPCVNVGAKGRAHQNAKRNCMRAVRMPPRSRV